MINKTYPIAEKVLSQGLQHHQALVAVLETEAETLSRRAPSLALNKLAEQKKQLVESIEQFSQQWTQILATESLPLTREGVQQYFVRAQSSNLDTQKGLKMWRQIHTLMKTCQHINEKNGASIALLMRHNQRILQVFRGKSQQPTTYTAKGSTASMQYSRTIASV